MGKKWTDEDTKFLKANVGRMDAQSLAHSVGATLEELEKKLHLLRLVPAEPPTGRKGPATLKEATREATQARKEYEKAIGLFHKRQLDEAAEHFEALIERSPDEKELVDRARMYLQACRNGKKARGAASADADDLFHSAVFEKNRGNVDRALDLLKKSTGKKDGDGRVHYLAACCYALTGDSDQALANLRKAIAASDQNRIQARLEADLASLRGHAEFAELVAGA